MPDSMNKSTGPETAALLLLVSPHNSSHKLAAINRYFETSGFDWGKFTEIALWHRLVPLLARQIDVLAPQYFPQDIKDALKVYRENNRQRSRLLLDELHKVTSALEGAGIRVMTVKGPVFAAQAYGDISLREYNDIDFMVDKTDYYTTISCLLGLGYTCDRALQHGKELLAWRYYGQDILFKSQLDIAVEPHWRLLPATFPASPQFTDLWPNSTRYEVQEYRFASPALEDTLLVLCIHHGKEHWLWLRQICDVAHFVDRNPGINWPRTLALADRWDCMRALLLGLSLSRQLLSIDLPESVVRLIESDRAVGRLKEDAITGLYSGQQGQLDLQRVSGFRFKLQDNLVRRCSYVLRTVLMPSNAHFGIVYFAPSLEWLYYPVKWVHDYLLLPLWKLYKRVFAT